MKKMYPLIAAAGLCACLGAGLVLPEKVVAGPRIDFGEESYLQLDVKLQGIMDYTDFGSSNDGQDSRYDLDLRRARIVFTGMMNDTWGAKFQTCGGTSATRNFGAGGYELAKNNSKTNSQIRLTDGYLIGLIDDAFNVKIGLTKIPLTRANLDECFNPLSHDRSAFVYSPYGTDATKNSRDMGFVASGNFFDDHLKYFASVMEGREGSAKFENPFNNVEYISSPEPNSNLEYVARFHYSFLDQESGPTAMGYKGTYLGKKGKIFTLGLAGAYEADAAYKNVTDSTRLNEETVDYTAWTADLFFEYPFADGSALTATALYLNADFEDAYKTITYTNTAAGNNAVADLNTVVGGLVGQKEGWYVKAGYLLPFTLGAKGKLQPFARYEDWDVAFLFGQRDQEVKQVGFGINYFVLGDDRVRFTLEYYNTEFDKPTRMGDYLSQTGANTLMYTDYDTITAMFMVQL